MKFLNLNIGGLLSQGAIFLRTQTKSFTFTPNLGPLRLLLSRSGLVVLANLFLITSPTQANSGQRLAELISAENWQEASEQLRSLSRGERALLTELYPRNEYESSLLWMALQPVEHEDSNKKLVVGTTFTEDQQNFIKQLVQLSPQLLTTSTGSPAAPLIIFMLEYFERLTVEESPQLEIHKLKFKFLIELMKEHLPHGGKIEAGYPVNPQTGQFQGPLKWLHPEWVSAFYSCGGFLEWWLAENNLTANTLIRGERELSGDERGWFRSRTSFEIPLWALIAFSTTHEINDHFFKKMHRLLATGIELSLAQEGVQALIRPYNYHPELKVPLASLVNILTLLDPEKQENEWQRTLEIQLHQMIKSFFIKLDGTPTGLTGTTPFDYFGFKVSMLDIAYSDSNHFASEQLRKRFINFIQETIPLDLESLNFEEYELLLANAISTRDRWLTERLLSIADSVQQVNQGDRFIRLNRQFTGDQFKYNPTVLNLAMGSILNDGDVDATYTWLLELIAHGAHPDLQSGAGYTFAMEPSWSRTIALSGESLPMIDRIKDPQLRQETRRWLIGQINQLEAIVNSAEFRSHAYQVYRTQAHVPFSSHSELNTPSHGSGSKSSTDCFGLSQGAVPPNRTIH